MRRDQGDRRRAIVEPSQTTNPQGAAVNSLRGD